MGFGNISLEALLEQKWFSQIPEDFGEEVIPEHFRNLTLKNFIQDFGALYQSFRDFYKGTIKPSQGYVRDFIAFIQNIEGKEFTENGEKRTLRNYQKTFILDCLKFLVQSKENAGYIHSATSTGKTVIFGEIVKHIHTLSPTSKVLVVVSGTEALTRAKKEFEELGIDTGVYYSKEKNLSHTITLITRQSLIRSGKDTIDPESISLMICDEIHDGFLGKESSKVLNQFPCKKIGFTATPELRDKRVEDIFKKMIGQYLIDEGQRDGYLPQIDDRQKFELPDSYFGVLKKQGDDYSEASLQAFQVDDIFPQVLDFLKNGPGKEKQFAIFMPSVAASKRISQYFEEKGGIKIVHLDGKTSEKKIHQAKEDFETGKIQVITSCDKMSQSWDSDTIDGVINLRPTLSPSKYFQIIGRALHGKEIVDGEKFPKKEVMVVDLVNSKESYKNRTITASGLKRVLGETQTGTKPRKEIISKDTPKLIREIEMYFDIPQLDISQIAHLLKNFREKLGVPETDFYEYFQEDIFHYDTETEETISLVFSSNSVFGKSYSGKTRNFDLSLGVFLRLVLKNIPSISEIRNFGAQLPSLEDYKNELQKIGPRVQLKYMFLNISNSGIYQQVALHLYSYLSEENRKQVDISGKKLSQFCCVRIFFLFIQEHCGINVGELQNIELIREKKIVLGRNHGLFMKQDGNIGYIEGFEQHIRKGGIRFQMLKNIAPDSEIIHKLSPQGGYHITWNSIKVLTPLKYGITFRTLEKKDPTPEEVQNILRSFFDEIGYSLDIHIYNEISSKESHLNQYFLSDLISDLFPLVRINGILNDLNIQSSLNPETQEFILDCSDIRPRPGITFHVLENTSDTLGYQATKTYIPQDASLKDFTERLKQLVKTAKTLNQEGRKELKSKIIHRNIKNVGRGTIYVDSKGSRSIYTPILLSLFEELGQALDIKILTTEKESIAQTGLHHFLIQETSDSVTDIQHASDILIPLGITYNPLTQTWEFARENLMGDIPLLERYKLFFEQILKLEIFRENAPFWISQKINWYYDVVQKYLGGSENARDHFMETKILDSAEEYNLGVKNTSTLYDIETHLFEIIEVILDYSGVIYRNTYYYPYGLDALKKSFFSEEWENFLQRIDITTSNGVLDFSKIKGVGKYKEFKRIVGVIHEIYTHLTPEERDFLKQKGLNFKSGTYPIQDILTLFCEKTGIEYISKKKIKEQQKGFLSTEVLFSEDGITELEKLGIVIDRDKKTLDFSEMKGLSTVKFFQMGIKTYFSKLISTLSDTERNPLENKIFPDGIITYDKLALKKIILYFGKRYGWKNIDQFQKEQEIFPLLKNLHLSFGGSMDEKIIALKNIIQLGDFQIRKRSNNSFGAAPSYTNEEIYIQNTGDYFLIIDWDNHKIKFGEVIKGFTEESSNTVENIFGDNIHTQNNCFDNDGNVGFIGRISIEI